MFGHRKPSDRSVRILRGACSVLVLGALLVLGLGATAAAAPKQVTADYPRLGMWWPNNDRQPVADRARYDFIQLQNHDADHIAELRAANPDIIVLGATNARELNWRLTSYNDPLNVELRSASTDWMLTQAGSTLTAAVTNASTTIPVGDTSRFRTGEMVLVDRELMYVTGVGSSSLTVTRGQVTPTAPHAAGARIAAVVSVWPTCIEFDLTAACPKADVGNGPETWTEWNVRRGVNVVNSADWDGLVIDCYDQGVYWWVTQGYVRSIDRNRDNVADDLDALSSAWSAGLVNYGSSLKAAVGDRIVHANGLGTSNLDLNGSNFETYPSGSWDYATWKTVVIGPYSSPRMSYVDHAAKDAGPNLTTMYTYGTQADYQRVRFGLASALMGNGFYAYVSSVGNHGIGGLWWYDEYDNAGKGRGYLGQPTGAAYTPGSNVWRRDYEGGIALVNGDTVPRTVSLGGVFQKIKGTQAPSVNDGSLVTQVTLQPRDGIVLLREEPDVADPVTPPTDPSVADDPSTTDPSTGGPAVPSRSPLHRFYNVRTGTHFYTASDAEKAKVASTLAGTYQYEGISYKVSPTPADSIPVYRFYNVKKGVHFYTASAQERDKVMATLGHTFNYEGIAFNASASNTAGTAPVYRFYNVRTGTHFYTASAQERDRVIATMGATYQFEGVAYRAWLQ